MRYPIAEITAHSVKQCFRADLRAGFVVIVQRVMLAASLCLGSRIRCVRHGKVFAESQHGPALWASANRFHALQLDDARRFCRIQEHGCSLNTGCKIRPRFPEWMCDRVDDAPLSCFVQRVACMERAGYSHHLGYSWLCRMVVLAPCLSGTVTKVLYQVQRKRKAHLECLDQGPPVE